METGANSWPDVDLACERAWGAFGAWSVSGGGERAQLLETLAEVCGQHRDWIIGTASDETALRETELEGEFARMVGTMRMFAGQARDGAWVRASVDRASKESVGPGHDVRSLLVPIGPVAVFGASNFPLAYGVLGGDTISALSAGCTVVVKEHPAHPRLGRLLAELCEMAVASAGAPRHVVQYVTDERPGQAFEVATRLVTHARLAGVGFTGSRRAGLAIDAMARQRPVPIPVFAEMGSSNVVLIARGAARERGEQIAGELADSILARFGQQCTCAGLVLIDVPGASRAQRTVHPIIEQLRARLLAHGPREMLTPGVRDNYQKRLDDLDTPYDSEGKLSRTSAEPIGERASVPALMESDLAELKWSGPRYREEIFGPACIVACIDLDEPGQLREVLESQGLGDPWSSLVSSIYLPARWREQDRAAAEALRAHTGRLCFNTLPTGVRVCTSMVHGGPYPATNVPQTTAVGPRAIERWCRPACYQNCPDALLPPELQDGNPLGLWRTVNGELTRAGVDR
jgi:NADP-dependent aldehyde dehydrogenase